MLLSMIHMVSQAIPTLIWTHGVFGTDWQEFSLVSKAICLLLDGKEPAFQPKTSME